MTNTVMFIQYILDFLKKILNEMNLEFKCYYYIGYVRHP